LLTPLGPRIDTTSAGAIAGRTLPARFASHDPGKRAAIADFLGRLQKARAWVQAHKDTYADTWAAYEHEPGVGNIV